MFFAVLLLPSQCCVSLCTGRACLLVSYCIFSQQRSVVRFLVQPLKDFNGSCGALSTGTIAGGCVEGRGGKGEGGEGERRGGSK